MLLGNADRFPCEALGWRGNPHNIMYSNHGPLQVHSALMSDSDFTTTIEMPQQACVISLALQLPLQLPLNLPSSLTLPLLLGLPLLLPLCPFLALTTALAPAPAPALDPILALALVLALLCLPKIPTNLNWATVCRAAW